jgi:hypothetical protein
MSVRYPAARLCPPKAGSGRKQVRAYHDRRNLAYQFGTEVAWVMFAEGSQRRIEHNDARLARERGIGANIDGSPDMGTLKQAACSNSEG